MELVEPAAVDCRRIPAGGSGNDRLSGGAGADAFDAGAGNDAIDARDRRRETIRCGSGRDRVAADRNDRLIGCEHVTRR
jgi:Ca2+-binding RTX toxin-like protein